MSGHVEHATLKPGDRITVTGGRAKDGSFNMRGVSFSSGTVENSWAFQDRISSARQLSIPPRHQQRGGNACREANRKSLF